MTIEKSSEAIRDFALYSFKAFHDIIYQAFLKGDPGTLKAVLDEFCQTLENYFERRGRRDVKIIGIHLDHSEGVEKTELQSLYNSELRKQAIADSLILAREEVIFGLSGRALELTLADPSDVNITMTRELMARLPASLTRLVIVFENANKRSESDFWGWHWFDSKPDGKVHTVDAHSRPNRIFVAKALQILDADPNSGFQADELTVSDDLIYLFETTHGQSIPAMARTIAERKDVYLTILTESQIGRVERLLELIVGIRVVQEEKREERLAKAKLNLGKIKEFRDGVISAFKASSHIKPMLQRLGCYHDLISEPPPKEVISLGYNQLDEKGAFITDWHVSYPNWGEGYGRGLAVSADQRAYAQFVGAATSVASVGKGNLITTLDEQIRKRAFRNPVVLQSVRTIFEYGKIRRRDLFIANYRSDCPKTQLNDLDGFIGVLNVADQNVPVIDVFVQDDELRNKVVVSDFERFITWEQFNPAQNSSRTDDVFSGLLIRVYDLNEDQERREKLLAECPDWLKEKGDKAAQEKFLRMHVVINVFQRYRVQIADAEAAICVTVKPSVSDDD